ncbi:MAG TPA: ABC transporter permease [Gemmatimonadales bacterium]|jgi:putative ABC transport system permease protein|nr:ABC transporter permease [Gemmatimonadales bacterium]
MAIRLSHWCCLPAVLLAARLTPAAAQIPEIAVERHLARELGLSVGDTLRLGPTPDTVATLVRVAAVYEPRPDPAEIAKRERHLRMHVPDLASLLRLPDRVDRLSIGLNPGISSDSAVAALNRTAFGYRAYATAAIASESSQTFLVVSRFHRAIAVITIVASAVFLLCIMLLKVEERRLDAAVMRFIGVRRRTIFGALLLEAAVVAAFGSILGTGLAYLAGAATNAYYGRFFDTRLIFSLITPELVLFSVALSLALGIAAGALAAWRLVHTRPLVLWGRG